MVMVRPLRPKEEQTETATLSDSSLEPKSAKRRCVSSACIPCRKRKSKCDGAIPNCSTCVAVYHTECAYEVEPDDRRKGTAGMARREPETSRERNRALATIVTALRTSSDAEVADILHQIRAGEALDVIADSLKGNMTLPARSDSQSLEGDFADIMGIPTINQSGDTRQFGHTSTLGLVPSEDDVPFHTDIPTETWTRVTRDRELVGHLMGLYFCWQHPFYVVFSKECFLYDMARSRPKYCSPLLVNALLACACGFSDRPEARVDPAKPETAGDQFFAEAKRLLFEDERSSLTTVQALALMSLREGSCGRDSSGYQYAGRCMRMALELGLHLCFAGSRLSPTEIEVRKITFWGCFTVDTAWSVCIGRISQLPRTAVSLKKPTLTDEIERKTWRPYVESDVLLNADLDQSSHTTKFLHQFSFLSEIVNDTVVMFYAPRERFTSKRLLDFYARYTQWHQALPSVLALTDRPTPHLVCLHMYYHTVVLHLFRPFLKVNLLYSSVSPREVCTQSAENISSLANLHRNLYSLRRACAIMAHCILSASTIHLLNLPSLSASGHLTSDLRHLREMSINHAFAGRCSRIVELLAQKWGIALPDETNQARGRTSAEPSSVSPTSTYLFSDPGSASQSRTRRDSMADLLPNLDTSSTPSPSLMDLFWTPFPYQGVPLQGTLDQGPMDISAMLDVRNNNWEQYTRDGFKMANGNDLAMGGPSLTDEEWARILG